jgi:hypothetical protein
MAGPTGVRPLVVQLQLRILVIMFAGLHRDACLIGSVWVAWHRGINIVAEIVRRYVTTAGPFR